MADTHPEIQPASRREWWPDSFIDEVMPRGRAAPSDWLFRVQGGGYAYGDPNDLYAPPTPVAEGQIVEFTYMDSLGTSRVTVDENGTATWEPPLPAAVNHIYDGCDPDTICDTADGFAELISDRGSEETEIAALSHVGERNIRCRFTSAGGVLRFLPLDPEPAPPADPVDAPARDDAQGDLLSAPSDTKESAGVAGEAGR